MTIFSGLRVGDVVYCHNSVVMNGDGMRACTKGKNYTVTKISSGDFRIRNDNGQSHLFDITGKNYDSGRWFTPHRILEPYKKMVL